MRPIPPGRIRALLWLLTLWLIALSPGDLGLHAAFEAGHLASTADDDAIGPPHDEADCMACRFVAGFQPLLTEPVSAVFVGASRSIAEPSGVIPCPEAFVSRRPSRGPPDPA